RRKRPRRQRECASVRHGFHGGAGALGSFLVKPTGKRRKALFLEHLTNGRGTERDALVLHCVTDVVDRIVALAQAEDRVARRGLLWLRARAWFASGEERGLALAPKVVTHHAEGTGAVAEPLRDIRGRDAIDEERPKRFVLALLRFPGL